MGAGKCDGAVQAWVSAGSRMYSVCENAPVRGDAVVSPTDLFIIPIEVAYRMSEVAIRSID